ncbi:hypothetical protein FJTKL_03407 [Diaporthe vaccinii]|uniref:Hexosyltransferase n=1 Tax=Diaporthe vaccinii TaxID=105482 RepID=A0ABR4F215_9PEZI
MYATEVVSRFHIRPRTADGGEIMYREAGGSDRSMSGAVSRLAVYGGDTDNRVWEDVRPLYARGRVMYGMLNVSAGWWVVRSDCDAWVTKEISL